ncbi:hypothetical protein [uncultured Vagococcus sp.]|uniref:hypothetical protein n=1 Tax=uncultured Vagococcus sp. TaxID=189676 RepID=UPI00258C01B7|nr:hypothetical protein [uncultured Vagococcus sp.]
MRTNFNHLKSRLKVVEQVKQASVPDYINIFVFGMRDTNDFVVTNPSKLDKLLIFSDKSELQDYYSFLEDHFKSVSIFEETLEVIEDVAGYNTLIGHAEKADKNRNWVKLW